MHSEVLTKKAEKLFSCFSVFKNFYLAGGTALAFQLGHRTSIDFDFFSEKPITKNLLKTIERAFRGIHLEVRVNNKDELTFFADEVKITALHYPFPLLLPLVKFRNIRVASSKEIALMKAYTIGRRGSFKDYIDLYFILKEKVAGLPEIVDGAGKKFKSAFDVRLFLEQLLYFEDLRDTKIEFLKRRVGMEEMKKFFEEEIKNIKL